MTEEKALWLHAVTRGRPPEQLSGLTGVGDAPVRAIEAGGLVAVVAPVDLAEYGADALRRNLEDLAWLESVSRAHHRVADAVGRFGPVVPTRLATVYRDETRVRTVLARQEVQFTAALDRVAGRIEWGVKAYAVGRPEDAEGDPAPARTRGAGAGSAYLNRRRAQLSATERSQQAAADGAAEVHAELSRRAEAARRHAPQDRRLSGQPGWMVLNGAYLVDQRRAGEFARLVDALGERHRAVRLELTGPWPPYSFVAVDDEFVAAEDDHVAVEDEFVTVEDEEPAR